IAEGRVEEHQNDHAQPDGEDGIGPCAGLDAAQIESGEEARIKNEPNLYSDMMQHTQIDCAPKNVDGADRCAEIHGRLGAPNHTDDWVHDVIEHHAPAGEIAWRCVNLTADVRTGRARAGI